MDIETAAIHKRAALWVFDQLLREGVVVYTPLLSIESVDAAIRCDDGRFKDILVRGSEDEHLPFCFSVDRFEPRENLYVVCIAWQVSPVQCWLFPSLDFIRSAAQRDATYLLDLESEAPAGLGKLRNTLARYRNAWRLLTDGAMKPFSP